MVGSHPEGLAFGSPEEQFLADDVPIDRVVQCEPNPLVLDLGCVGLREDVHVDRRRRGVCNRAYRFAYGINPWQSPGLVQWDQMGDVNVAGLQGSQTR